jgi:hypothetical protein
MAHQTPYIPFLLDIGLRDIEKLLRTRMGHD